MGRWYVAAKNSSIILSVQFSHPSHFALSLCTARSLGGHICRSNKQQTVWLAHCDAPALLGCFHVWPRHQTCPSGLPVRPLMLNYRSLELDSRGGKEKGETKEELKEKLCPLFFLPLSQYFTHPSHNFLHISITNQLSLSQQLLQESSMSASLAFSVPLRHCLAHPET